MEPLEDSNRLKTLSGDCTEQVFIIYILTFSTVSHVGLSRVSLRSTVQKHIGLPARRQLFTCLEPSTKQLHESCFRFECIGNRSMQ